MLNMTIKTTRCIECHERIGTEQDPCRCGRCEDCCSATTPEQKRDESPALYDDADDADDA